MSYQIIIKPSGHALKVESGETILEAVLREGFSLPYGCRNGSLYDFSFTNPTGTIAAAIRQRETLAEGGFKNSFSRFYF